MDCVTLVEQAQAQGLRITVKGDRLIVRGPKEAGDLAELLLERKREVIALLTGDLMPRIPEIPRNTSRQAEAECPCALCSGAGATGIPDDDPMTALFRSEGRPWWYCACDHRCWSHVEQPDWYCTNCGRWAEESKKA